MIAIDVAACTGCRMCELVCSFHHKGVFSPELSSIKVSRNNRTGEIQIFLDNTCDLCQEEVSSTEVSVDTAKWVVSRKWWKKESACPTL